MNITLLKNDASGEFATLQHMAGERGILLYLVGGALRDYIAGRKVSDFDFAVGNARNDLPWEFSKTIGGSCFWLDEERGQCRVVLKRGSESVTFDFAPIRGASIEEDLRLRDFTVNALAVEVSGNETLLVDPLSGLVDLNNRTLRCCSASAFIDDPIRLLRAFRIASTLAFTLDEATFQAVRDNARLITIAAPERIRDELFKILSAPDAGRSFLGLHSTGILSYLFPEQVDLEHGIDSIRQMEEMCALPDSLLPENGLLLAEYLNEVLEGELTIGSILKFTSFVRESGCWIKGDDLCKRFRLGHKARHTLLNLLESMDKHASVFRSSVPTDRGMYRFFMDLKGGPELALFAFVHHDLPIQICSRLLSFYFFHYHFQKELLSGAEIMAIFQINEGKEVGAAIRLLRSGERTGEVSTKEDAIAFLGRKLLTKNKS